MFVRDIMQHDVACARPETRLDEVLRLLQRRGVRHVPVLHDEALVGIISDRDMKSVLPQFIGSPFEAGDGRTPRLTAGDIMTKHVLTVDPMALVEDAARVMVEQRIGAMPVIREGRLVGILTETDVLLLFVRAMGILEPSSRIDVLLPPDRSCIARLVHTVESTGVGVSSLVTLANPSLSLREAVVCVPTINPGPVIAALDAQGFAVRSPTRVSV